MSKIGELPTGNYNTKQGKEARLIRLQNSHRERLLSGLFRKKFISFYQSETWLKLCDEKKELLKLGDRRNWRLF